MSSTIQLTTISGEIIEKAKWSVQSFASIQNGHTISICIDTNDTNLIRYLRKQEKVECCIDKKVNKHFIVATFIVKQIRHMIDGDEFNSMCMIMPVNRYVEQTLLYIFDKSKCSLKFIESIKLS